MGTMGSKKPFFNPIVHISEISSNSIIAGVKEQDVEIRNLGTEKFDYKCSCGVWHADVKRGTLPYCVHYLYVLAELIRQGLISGEKSKLNRLDYDGFNRLGSLVAEISSYEVGLEEFRKGKILLCRSCANSYHASPLTYVSIDKLTETRSGFKIEGVGVCPNDGSHVSLFRNVGADLENLKCPTCGERNCRLSLEVEKAKDGYVFVAGLECKTRKCVWKKTFKSEAQSASEIFATVRKLRISQDGIRIERDAGEGLVMYS